MPIASLNVVENRNGNCILNLQVALIHCVLYGSIRKTWAVVYLRNILETPSRFHCFNISNEFNYTRETRQRRIFPKEQCVVLNLVSCPVSVCEDKQLNTRFRTTRPCIKLFLLACFVLIRQCISIGAVGVSLTMTGSPRERPAVSSPTGYSAVYRFSCRSNNSHSFCLPARPLESQVCGQQNTYEKLTTVKKIMILLLQGVLLHHSSSAVSFALHFQRVLR